MTISNPRSRGSTSSGSAKPSATGRSYEYLMGLNFKVKIKYKTINK
jgi:hypothetical protein